MSVTTLAHLLRSPLRRPTSFQRQSRLTDLSKLNSALADHPTPRLERQQSEEISVGDEVDIHLGEL